MRENVMGPSNELFCHPELEKFEDCARWFEQQPLLKDSGQCITWPVTCSDDSRPKRAPTRLSACRCRSTCKTPL